MYKVKIVMKIFETTAPKGKKTKTAPIAAWGFMIWNNNIK